jgi:hypothetical protein
MIKQWEHDGVKFEDTPCSKCSLEERSCGTLPYDDARGAEAAVCRCAAHGGSDPEAGIELMPVKVLADAVRLLLSLPKDALEVIRLRYGGMPYAEIAELMGKGVDAVEKRHLRVLEKNPALGALFPRKVRKRRARQRRGVRGKKPG